MATPTRIDAPVLPTDLGADGEWRLARRSFPVVKGHDHNYLEVGRYWKDAQDKVAEFNRQPDRVYKFDEQNSNNFARNLLGRVNLESQSGVWDGNGADYGANGFNYSPRQWNVRDVFDPAQAVTRETAPPSRSLDQVTRAGLEADRPNP